MSAENIPPENPGEDKPDPIPREPTDSGPDPKIPPEEVRAQPVGPRVILDQLEKETAAAENGPVPDPSVTVPAAETVQAAPAADLDNAPQELVSDAMKKLDALLREIKQAKADNP